MGRSPRGEVGLDIHRLHARPDDGDVGDEAGAHAPAVDGVHPEAVARTHEPPTGSRGDFHAYLFFQSVPRRWFIVVLGFAIGGLIGHLIGGAGA